jgi:hypothetical protein
MTTDTKLRLRNITSKASLCYGSENWIISKRDAQKLVAAQMRILRPLLRRTRLDRQRNRDIRNRLKVNKRVKDIKLYQKKWLDRLERMDRNRLPRLAFQYHLGDGGIWEDQEEDGETKNILSFKGTDFKT